MKILAGIVLYNPDFDRLVQNIEAVIFQVDFLVLIENGSMSTDFLSYFSNDDRLIVIQNKTNQGISFALNQIMEYASINGYEWAITLDQDSVVAESLIETYRAIIMESDVGIVTCRINDRNFILKESMVMSDVEELDVCITSGSMVKVSAWSEVGGFDNFLFIDFVDFDFCFSLRKHNWRILKTNKSSILHEVGKSKIVRFFGQEYLAYNHIPFRYYYQTRNPIYVAFKHNHSILKVFHRLFIRFNIVIYYESNKMEKLRYMVRGLFDGLTRNNANE